MTTGPAPIEKVKRTNAVMVQPQQRTELAQHSPYAMEIDRGRNCYTYREFRYMAQHCRNRRQRGKVMDGRKLEYRGGREGHHEHSKNLKEKENLESLN